MTHVDPYYLSDLSLFSFIISFVILLYIDYLCVPCRIDNLWSLVMPEQHIEHREASRDKGSERPGTLLYLTGRCLGSTISDSHPFHPCAKTTPQRTSTFPRLESQILILPTSKTPIKLGFFPHT